MDAMIQRALKAHKPMQVVTEGRYRVLPPTGYRLEGSGYQVIDSQANHPHLEIVCYATHEQATRIADALNRDGDTQ